MEIGCVKIGGLVPRYSIVFCCRTNQQQGSEEQNKRNQPTCCSRFEGSVFIHGKRFQSFYRDGLPPWCRPEGLLAPYQTASRSVARKNSYQLSIIAYAKRRALTCRSCRETIDRR